MADEKQVLTEQLHAAQDLHAKNTLALREIHELLAKADARRKAEPENLRRWDQVLDHLETSLVQARARLNSSEHQLSVARRALQDVLGAEALRVVEASHETPDTTIEASTFETRLEQVIGAENAAAALNDDKISETVLPAITEVPSDTPITEQQALQSAITKIQGHRVHALNAVEVRATMAAYDRLSRQHAPNLKDQRLMRILSAAVKIFQRTARRNNKT